MQLGLTIDGNDWSMLIDQGKCSFTKALSGTFSKGKFSLSIPDVKDASGLPLEYSEVILTNLDTSTKVFRGVVTTITIAVLSGNLQEWAVDCIGLEYLLDNAVYSHTWAGQTDRQIIQDTFTAVLSEIATTSATVDEIQIDLDFVAVDLTVRQIMNNLCQLTGGEYRIDEEKNLIYRLEGSKAATGGFSDNPTNKVIAN